MLLFWSDDVTASFFAGFLLVCISFASTIVDSHNYSHTFWSIIFDSRSSSHTSGFDRFRLASLFTHLWIRPIPELITC
ncbi:hypothetical protein ACCO45_012084 [Purpureocillium lilacinum]|uniref:Uncharacterized protein n=1 Tax=Purpureocillium lilacinum TaxID=33203 RepID=A0ACC4DFP0_PURLI